MRSIKEVQLRQRKIADYRSVISDDLYDEIAALKDELRGFSVLHLNATPAGGGVAEILSSMVPLLRSLGVKADWYVLNDAEPAYFEMTKKLHNLLQGKRGELTRAEKDLYLAYAERYAKALRGMRYDFWVIHDPQPLPVIAYLERDSARWAWRSHIDTSRPNREALDFLVPYIDRYDHTIFSLAEYAPRALRDDRLLVFKPAIDPLTPKNQPLNKGEADKILRSLGLDPARPIMVQVSRFDPWKDPMGVIDAFLLAREDVPDLQLALVGVFSAQDDPEAPRVFAEVKEYADGHPDIHLFHDPRLVGDPQINAFQTGADVVLQKSLREGFGLTVTEAMWKGKAVVAGNAGGIRSQIVDGTNGYLVSSAAEAAERTVTLLQDDTRRAAMGAAARESAREGFLIPRLVRDYLRLFAATSGVRSFVEEVRQAA